MCDDMRAAAIQDDELSATSGCSPLQCAKRAPRNAVAWHHSSLPHDLDAFLK